MYIHPRHCFERHNTSQGGVSDKVSSIIQMKTIGELIKEELEKQERSVTWFARKLSCDRSNVYRLFHKHSIETDLLIRISIILNRDFSSEISSIIHQKQQSHNQQQK